MSLRLLGKNVHIIDSELSEWNT